jgi:hypothetical protein
LISPKKITAGYAGLAGDSYGVGVKGKLYSRERLMNDAKPIDPRELVKWLVALQRAINTRAL